ncbi:hypothetical protein LWM68_30950 [Niabella sp. W65]|nr:hypothetical protein [Niabella sp. W65]MCH7366794.1 hypothetical protein [Niabella sp. W65]ULT42501.1 hypothetical protein KRR40_02500 [Niabella sp. I65]
MDLPETAKYQSPLSNTEFSQGSKKKPAGYRHFREEGLAHCWINQNAKLSLGYFEKGHQANYQFRPENMCLFVFNISGNITVNGQQVSERDAIGVWDTDQISINCNEESEFLIIETVINQK